MYSIKKAEKKIRKRRILAASINTVLFSILFASIAYFYSTSNYEATQFFWIKSFGSLVVITGLIYFVTGLYYDSTVKLVMPYVITKFEDRFGKDFAYSQSYDIPRAMLDESGLVNTADRFRCSNMIKVQYPDGDKMLMCNVSTYNVTKDKEGRETEHLVDSGIFVNRATDLDTGTHFVIRDKQYFASKSMNLKGEDLLLIPKVQPAFDKYYNLYTTDSIRTLRFLSPSVIEKFMNMAKVKGHVSELSLFDDQVYLFINGANIEVYVQSLFVTPKIDKMVKKSFDNISTVLDMVDFVYNEQRITRLSKRKPAS